MVTITWKIDNIEVKPEDEDLTDVVCMVSWRVYAEESDTIVSNYGTVEIPPAEEETFIAFEDLDEETVIEWVHSVMGDEKVETLENSVESQLIAILIPAVVSKPLPWL
jgi:hypothetical protein